MMLIDFTAIDVYLVLDLFWRDILSIQGMEFASLEIKIIKKVIAKVHLIKNMIFSYISFKKFVLI